MSLICGFIMLNGKPQEESCRIQCTPSSLDVVFECQQAAELPNLPG